MEKVNGIGKGVREDLSSDNEDVDSEIEWLSWVESELSEDVSTSEDPNYLLPPRETQDGLPQNSIIITSARNFNLRYRRHYKLF